MSDLNRDFKKLGKLSSSRKLILTLFLLVLFILGFTLGILFSRTSRPRTTTVVPRRLSSPTVKPTTTLSLSPGFQTVSVGETFPVSVKITKELVQAVDVVLIYDPTVFTVSELKRGKIFPFFLREKMEEGKITVSASVTPENPVATGSGEIFKVLFTAISATPSSRIDFDREETITARSGENTLGEAVGGSYIIE